MDVKQYYRKIHELEETLTDKYPVVLSLDTTDGGKSGVLSEVPRAIAAKMIIEGRAVLASPAEKEKYFEQQAIARKQAEKAELARRVQVAIISDPGLKVIGRSAKDIEPVGANQQE